VNGGRRCAANDIDIARRFCSRVRANALVSGRITALDTILSSEAYSLSLALVLETTATSFVFAALEAKGATAGTSYTVCYVRCMCF
jgi:hypothetical protein